MEIDLLDMSQISFAYWASLVYCVYVEESKNLTIDLNAIK